MISTTPAKAKLFHTWRSHSTENWILLFPLEGKGIIKMDSKEIKVEKNDLLLISPNTPHTYFSSTHWKLLWLHFKLSPDLLKNMVWEENLPHLRKITLTPAMFAKTRLALMEANTLNQIRKRGWYSFATRLIESAILRIYTMLTDNGKHFPEWLPQAMELLCTDDSEINMDNIAKKFALSRTVFYEEFRNATGYTPGVYRELCKMRQAEQLLLQTSSNIAQIAYQCGYDNPLYFSARFKKYYGLSPRNYREKFKNPS